jgi:AraC-like DNA-binding protein
MSLSMPGKDRQSLPSQIVETICSKPWMMLADLCIEHSISRKRCQYLLISEFGFGFRKIHSVCRLCHSVRMLSSGQMIKQGAYECGYRHPQNFNRAFKKYFGQPPSACKNSGAWPKMRDEFSCPLHYHILNSIADQSKSKVEDLISV